ncbi:hypothetical protein [Allorhodopirellula heiligendammensis]|uniref:Transmembrane protein n=1 Tax=Allorhodopirellula heiligendammensis TaxID=2714739 RepID=A0A5C6BST7_9BACT|nr:hypothetical protein [Allorhodopirellula heiligendammensis]TWU15303.1 hypothetical protein Poly21_24980 [Allorhodopirellula heiligendammensis]
MTDQSLETVASVVARLGVPPPDIAELWLEDARPHFDVGENTRFDADATAWQHMVVNEFGRAVLPPRSLELPRELERKIAEDSSTGPNATPQSSSLADKQGVGLAVRSKAGLLEGHSKSPRRRSARRQDVSRRHRPSTRTILAGSAIAAVALLVVVLTLRSPSAPDRSAPDPSRETFAANKSVIPTDLFSPEPIADPESLQSSPPPRRQSSPGPVVAAATEVPGSADLMSLNADPPVNETPSVGGMEAMPADLSLDSLVPSVITESDEASPPTTTETTISAVDITDMSDEDAALDEAVPQATAAIVPPQKQTTAVTLPRPPTASEAALLPPALVLMLERAPTRLQLEFPTEPALHLRPEQGRWAVIAIGRDLPIAVFEIDQDGGGDQALRFRWLAAASQTPSAESLIHGRITTAEGDVVYLRSSLDAQAIATDLSERDEKLKWLLGGPILHSVTHLRLDLQVPDDVSLRWMESADEESPQKTRAIALLTLKDSAEPGELAARIDVRTSGSLSMRLRYGARLAPAMPWLWTDASSIRSSLDATTRQLELADEQLLQLETAISRAGKLRARRQEVALEIQRDSIEEAVRNGTLVAKRLAELDQLVALLDAEGQISLSLEVRWPDDSTQTILALRPTEDHGNP